MGTSDLSALISDIYDATLDPEIIPIILRRLCTLTKSSCGLFAVHNERMIVHSVYQGIDPHWQSMYEVFEHQNLFFKRRHLARDGRAILGEQLAPLEELRQLEFFHEVLRPAGAVHLLGLSINQSPGMFVQVSLSRPEHHERHGRRELAVANVVARHLRRAFSIACRMQSARASDVPFEKVFDRLVVGALLVDQTGRLIQANAAAVALLRHNRPLRLRNGWVVADTASNQRKWQMLLDRFAPRNGPAEGTAVALDIEDAGTLNLVATPVRPSRAEFLGLAPPSPGLGLVIFDSAAQLPETASAMLQRLFGLTFAEAELSTALLNGETLNGYAERRGRSLNTVKTHLRSVFAKTDTSRQAELVRKLSVLTMLAH